MDEELLEGESEELEEAAEALVALTQDSSGQEDDEPEERPAPPVASLGQLKKKQRVTKDVRIVVGDEDGEPVEVLLRFRAIAAARYDKIMAAHPPRPKDKKAGYAYNPDTFGPAIVAATCVEPEMSYEDAVEIWESDDWNRGERMMLLMAAVEVCTAGLNVPFSKSVSGTT